MADSKAMSNPDPDMTLAEQAAKSGNPSPPKESAVNKETENLMALYSPPDVDKPFEEREPAKVVPHKDSDGADTPSGHALREVGVPDPKDAGSDAERRRGLKYRVEKYKKRWLS